MQIRFHSARELFTDMHAFVKRTGTVVLSADVPSAFPPLMGWAAVGEDADGNMINPPEERHWVITIGDLRKTSAEFFPEKARQKIDEIHRTASGRRMMANAILKMFCPQCGTFVAGEEHTQKECQVAEVMNS